MYAFHRCDNLEYIDTTNKLKYIGEYAFGDCYKL